MVSHPRGDGYCARPRHGSPHFARPRTSPSSRTPLRTKTAPAARSRQRRSPPGRDRSAPPAAWTQQAHLTFSLPRPGTLSAIAYTTPAAHCSAVLLHVLRNGHQIAKTGRLPAALTRPAPPLRREPGLKTPSLVSRVRATRPPISPSDAITPMEMLKGNTAAHDHAPPPRPSCLLIGSGLPLVDTGGAWSTARGGSAHRVHPLRVSGLLV